MISVETVNIKISKPIKKYINNPLLSLEDIPYPAEQVYNAGLDKFNGRYVMVFRNDYDRTQDYFALCEANNLGFPPRRIRRILPE